MKKRGVKLNQCIFTNCHRPCAGKRVVCDEHWCSCCDDATADDSRYVTIWGRVHFVREKRRSSAEIQHLRKLPYRPPDVLKELCPSKTAMLQCRARSVGFMVSDYCERIFPTGYYDDDNKKQICSMCLSSNRCKAHRLDKYGHLRQCWNLYDLENPQRKALFICNDDRCNVRVKCCRHIYGCTGGGYNDNVTQRDLTVRQMCKDCVNKHCLCTDCGRMAPFGKSILFSKYLYGQTAATYRSECIYCYDGVSNRGRVSMMLRWWVLRPTMDKWIDALHARGILSLEQAQFVMYNWNDSTVPQRALYLHKKRGVSNVKFVMRKFGGSESMTELMYRTAALPTDVFLIVLRMVAK